jgi:voltage-gated potassium channel
MGRASTGHRVIGHYVRAMVNTNDSAEYMTPQLARWRTLTDWPLMVLAIGSLPILLLEVARDQLPSADRVLIDVVNIVVLIAFLTDYLVELYLAGDRRRFVRSEWASLLIVVAQGVALIPALAAAGALRAFRGARAVRFVAIFLRAAAIGGAARTDGGRIVREHTAALAFGVAGMTWVTSAAAFTLAEDVGVDGRVHSFFDALWWSLATITTVGYGDIFPVTAAGRVIGGFTMLVGISTFALITAKIAQFLVREPPTS